MGMALRKDEFTNTRASDGSSCAGEVGRFPPVRSASPDHIAGELPGVVASVERIDAWMSIAKPGDRFVYASRAVLPIASAGAARMRALQERGLVRLYRPRCQLDRTIFNYMAERTSMRTPLTRPVRPVLGARLIDAEAALIDALLPVIERAAQFKRPCPTNRQLAERSGLDAAQVDDALEALILGGLIRVHAAAPPTLRRIMIVATGAQTGFAS